MGCLKRATRSGWKSMRQVECAGRITRLRRGDGSIIISGGYHVHDGPCTSFGGYHQSQVSCQVKSKREWVGWLVYRVSCTGRIRETEHN